MGASAGGLEAFTQLLKHLPAHTGMAFVLIQHLDPTHTSFLGETLSRATAMPVRQAENGDQVAPDHVYVIPPGANIGIASGRLSLTPRPIGSRDPHLPIDVFFRALATDLGAAAIGVVLSGTASDGTEGLRAIKAENGITFAQDPGTAKFGGMPHSAIDAGVVDYALPIPKLAAELVRLGGHPFLAGAGPDPDGDALLEIMELLRSGAGVDFAEYKTLTFKRRLARRMAVRQVEDTLAYVALLRADPDEVHALYEDVLIHVTQFFRDPEVFDALTAHAFPEIMASKAKGAPIRVWAAGCSTGEEAYSLAICLLELLGEHAPEHQIQIFGTDISDKAIERARAGVYPDSIVAHVSEERRRRYFTKTATGFRINKSVRDLCVFVRHDITRDPPFSKLDLVACRNVLIYFDLPLQKRVVPKLHYCLSQPGFLVLGRAESVTSFGRLFTPIDLSSQIFRRTGVTSQLLFDAPADSQPTVRLVQPARREAAPPVDVAKHLDRLLLARYAPPGVLVNDKLEILQFRGDTGPYLQPAQGEPQTNLMKMARGGLFTALRGAIARAKKEGVRVVVEGIDVEHGDSSTTCDVVVLPFTPLPDGQASSFVVLFEEVKRGKLTTGRTRPAAKSRVSRLELELSSTKEYLQLLIDEHARTNDELGSANEELISGNEELQSMNEELETAKEELQSTNEELTTVNDELHSRNHELSQVNSDLVNLIGMVDIPIVILDMDRKIRLFSPKARSILSVLPSDVGRPFDDIKPNIDVSDLDRQIADAIDTVTVKESEVQAHDGHWYRMQIRPYKTTDNRIEGAILSLVDIDALKHHVGEAEAAKADAEKANRAKDVFLATLSHELRTPLAAMLMQAQLLRCVELEPSRLLRAADVIERGTRAQAQLIDDLLDVSRIVAGKLRMDFHPIDLKPVIQAAVDGANAIAARKSIVFDVSLDESIGDVLGDASRLGQAVSNLVVNAVKFSPPKSRIHVALERADGRARVRVTDVGAGIEPAFLPHVFTRFMQEDSSTTRPHDGLGLGLAIVHHIVERHGGSVHAASAGPGKGATFSFMVPLVEQEQRASDAAPASQRAPGFVTDDSAPLAGMDVLVVDDDEQLRETLSEALEQMGAAVRLAESAPEGLREVAYHPPDIIVCDISMPGQDGYAFLRSLRALAPDRGGRTPAVALSALVGEEHQARALAAGFHDHIAKPVSIQQLARRLGELTGTVRSMGAK